MIKNWQMKGGSDTLSKDTVVSVEKVFIIDIKNMFPKDEDIALVKLRTPLSFSGEGYPRCFLSYEAREK